MAVLVSSVERAVKALASRGCVATNYAYPVRTPDHYRLWVGPAAHRPLVPRKRAEPGNTARRVNRLLGGGQQRGANESEDASVDTPRRRDSPQAHRPVWTCRAPLSAVRAAAVAPVPQGVGGRCTNRISIQQRTGEFVGARVVDSSKNQPAQPPPYAPVATELARAGGIRLLNVHCTASHLDPSYDEEHATESISLVKRGVFTCRTGSQPAVLGPGWLMLGNTGDPYVCSHEHGQDQGDDCLVLDFSAPTSELIWSAVGQSAGSRAFALASLPPLPRVCALMRLLEDSARQLGPDLDLREASFGVADCILRGLAAPGSSRRPASPLPCRGAERERIRQAVQFIEKEAAEELSLDVIASAVDLSPFHFLRVFRQQVGVTPHQYLIRARLLRAISLLRDTSLPITGGGP